MESLAALVAMIVFGVALIGCLGGLVAAILYDEGQTAELVALLLANSAILAIIAIGFTPAVATWYAGGWFTLFLLTYLWRRR